MLIWNVKDSCLKAAKTKDHFFSFGDEVPEDEIGSPERKEAMIKRGWLVEKKAKASQAVPKPISLPSKPLPLPKKESKPKPKKKGRR
jgi:hypothetical protein